MYPEWKKVGVLSTFLSIKPTAKRPLGVDERTVLEWILKKNRYQYEKLFEENSCKCGIEPPGSISSGVNVFNNENMNIVPVFSKS